MAMVQLAHANKIAVVLATISGCSLSVAARDGAGPEISPSR